MASPRRLFHRNLDDVKIQMTDNLNGVKMKPSKAAGRKPPQRRAAPRDRRRYHHGALRAALVAATEDLLLEQGVAGFTLRQAARRVGVSPSAPAHHFGDAVGLLSEVATLGFEEFAQALREADERGGPDPVCRLREQGAAYVAFARRYPARFQLMFRRDKRDPTHEGLGEAATKAFLVLEGAIRDLAGLSRDSPLTPAAFGALLAAWSMVHGFAHLALDGELDQIGGKPAPPAAQMLALMLAHLPQRI
jgi:AcrR family transcriptional regulator